MKIKQLLGPINKLEPIHGIITEVGDIRTVNLRTGRQAKVVDTVLEDDTGKMKLVLWDDQIDMVSPGIEVTIENGYVTNFRGEAFLNVGKFGRLIVKP